MSPQSEGGLGDNHHQGGQYKAYDPDRDTTPADYEHQLHPADNGRYQSERDLQETLPRPNGTLEPDNRLAASPSGSTNRRERDREGGPKRSGERNRSRTKPNGRTGSGQIRICKKCNEALTGQFVRALEGTFHLDCFRCQDCGEIVASKFFPVDDEQNGSQYPLCETDYFRRLDLICYKCDGALRGSYITALDRKYHIDHFTCSACTTIFGAQDSYYEHAGQVYCHYHYSTRFAQRCNGCHTAILKQFVEIFRNGQNQHWHPECYMIHKFWNVRLAPSQDKLPAPQEKRPSMEENPDQEQEEPQPEIEDTTDEAGRNAVRDKEEQMEEKVYKIWSNLSTFEESSAACISDMLLHVSNGAYMDGVMVAKKFICHVDVLFRSADKLDETMTQVGPKGLSYSREAKLLCKKIVAFFNLLKLSQEGGVRKLGVTQELLALVTGLAHYLKLLIRICLQGSLKVEREHEASECLQQFLDDLGDMEAIRNDDRSLEAATGTSNLASSFRDLCAVCKKNVEDDCARLGELRYHLGCLKCTNCKEDLGHDLEDVTWCEHDKRVFCVPCQSLARGPVSVGFQRVTRLQQFTFLLRVSLARLLEQLRTGSTVPRSSDDPNLNAYDSSAGHRSTGNKDIPLLSSENRSRSHGGPSDEKRASSSYENTLNDVRRLRSTRMDKHLSTTIKKARTSRIMEGPDGRTVADTDGAGRRDPNSQGMEERDGDSNRTELMYSGSNGITLDDIPRIVAAEQAKEQRPNAYKHARHELFRTSITGEPKLLSTHQRSTSAGHPLDLAAAGDPSMQGQPRRRYFSELSALEYFIIRHVAVIAMQPLLEGHFTMEELLNLIETRKATFWTKVGKALKTDAKKGSKKKGVFGVPLDVIIDRDGADSTEGVGATALRIPALVDDAVTTMRKMDLSVEGVFRKNGNIKRLNDTSAIIDKDGCEAVDFSKENVVQIAALLKKYLRELPDPLLTFKLHRLFITSQKITDEDRRRRVLHLTCCLLPKAHRDCLEVLCAFFNFAASFHQVDEESGSKMDTHNLATVIAPNILYTNAKTPADDHFLAIEVVTTLIEYNEQMCEVPEDLLSILSDQTLFNNPGDITTKEILKRYGDLGANGGPRHTVETQSSPLGTTKDGGGRALAPVVHRVEAESSQAHAYQKESSARHVQDPAAPYASSSNQNTPPQQWQGPDLEHPSMFVQQRSGTPDSQHGQRREYRTSRWVPPPNGSVGVTGAS
ncbi:uncharacterized protein L3040_004617 [Drepanopeziza brunnea f. sp. 'multigermtubi']|uniref:RhoGAP domain-containing protein n=1 Tax=Marssonina brunnea f. sp. multigermtubi (strain MB_m1) TaxID=1072389 RepID=K1XJZ8_MARBU|nr:RhoGAP domain-containing protein [Drepanopeziza brunnea f. sp. 'multigermtubi' MB_m1]EKD20998.1 RhoGAP domain-containing protein [Drepanopeziza brunnea f. sp. 'multigermtubi' MB_m1]KAJ5042059.1 hypothetical protein L3040_004617 [Drepanopeziza brunnea f. sp. 'multigermtubi']